MSFVNNILKDPNDIQRIISITNRYDWIVIWDCDQCDQYGFIRKIILLIINELKWNILQSCFILGSAQMTCIDLSSFTQSIVEVFTSYRCCGYHIYIILSVFNET